MRKKGTLLAWEVTEKKDVHLFVLIYFSWLYIQSEKISMKWTEREKTHTQTHSNSHSNNKKHCRKELTENIISNHISFSVSSHHFHFCFVRYYLSIDLKYRKRNSVVDAISYWPADFFPSFLSIICVVVIFERHVWKKSSVQKRCKEKPNSSKLDHWFSEWMRS